MLVPSPSYCVVDGIELEEGVLSCVWGGNDALDPSVTVVLYFSRSNLCMSKIRDKIASASSISFSMSVISHESIMFLSSSLRISFFSSSKAQIVCILPVSHSYCCDSLQCFICCSPSFINFVTTPRFPALTARFRARISVIFSSIHDFVGLSRLLLRNKVEIKADSLPHVGRHVMHFAYFELISGEFRNRFWFFLHLFIHKQSQYKHTLGYLICSIKIPQ